MQQKMLNKIFRLKNHGGESMKKSWKGNKDKNKTGLCNSILRGSGSNKSMKIFLPALILMLNLASALDFFRKMNAKLILMAMLILSMAALSIPQVQAAGTVSHPASEITAGTFNVGNFTFQNYLFITQWLGIGTSNPMNELNVIGTGNFTTDLYVAEQQVCREDGTNCPAGASETGNVTDVTATAPITSTGGATPNIAITLDGDLATTSPITGAVNNIFPGTGTKATIGVTVAKDIVTTSPLTVNGGANLDNVIIGSDADITIAIQDATTAQKGAVQLEDSTSSTSTTKAATPNSVKSAYDLANSKDNYGDWDLYTDGSARKSVTSAADVGFDSGTGIDVSWDGSRDVGFSFDCSDVTDSGNDGLSCSGEDLVVGAGDGLDVSTTQLSVDVTDIIGDGLAEDASNNLIFDCSDVISTGLACSGEDLYIPTTYRGANAICSGTDTYLDGEGNCDTASTIVTNGGGLKSESDTLATVTGRGATTATASSFTSTANPGLTVGNGATGYLKVGGSTISDAGGDLTLDSDSGEVYIPDELGIGTTNPSAKLEISDGSYSMRLNIDGATSEIFTADWGTNIEIKTTQSGGTVNEGQLYLKNDGNVGIGTTGPDTELHVKGGLCVDTDDACSDPGDGNVDVAGNIKLSSTGYIHSGGNVIIRLGV